MISLSVQVIIKKYQITALREVLSSGAEKFHILELVYPRDDAGIQGHHFHRNFCIVEAERNEHGAPVLILVPVPIPCAVARITVFFLFTSLKFSDNEIALALGIAKLCLRYSNQLFIIRQPFQSNILQADNKILLAFKIGRQIRLSEIFLHLKGADDVAGVAPRLLRNRRKREHACQYNNRKQQTRYSIQLLFQIHDNPPESSAHPSGEKKPAIKRQISFAVVT